SCASRSGAGPNNGSCGTTCGRDGSLPKRSRARGTGRPRAPLHPDFGYAQRSNREAPLIKGSSRSALSSRLTQAGWLLKPTLQSPARVPKPLRRAITGMVLLLVLGGIGLSFVSNNARPARTIVVQRGPLSVTVSVTGKVVTARDVGLSPTAPGT